jgi:uncharacterized protein (DUF2062 family)
LKKVYKGFVQHRLKKLLHRMKLSPEHIQAGKVGKWLGKHGVNPDLWSFRRGPVARAMVAGLLPATSPFLGLHHILALFLAVVMRANVPVAVVVQTVNNPLTIPIYYTMAYHVGEMMLGRPAKYENRIGEKIKKLDETDGIRAKLRMLAGELAMVAVPLMMGCTVIGVVVSVAGYGLVYVLWPDEPGEKKEGG